MKDKVNSKDIKNDPKKKQNKYKSPKNSQQHALNNSKHVKGKPSQEHLSTNNYKSQSNDTKDIIETAFLDSQDANPDDNNTNNDFGTISFNQ